MNNACACILACPYGAHACIGDGRVGPRHASTATREQYFLYSSYIQRFTNRSGSSASSMNVVTYRVSCRHASCHVGLRLTSTT